MSWRTLCLIILGWIAAGCGNSNSTSSPPDAARIVPPPPVVTPVQPAPKKVPSKGTAKEKKAVAQEVIAPTSNDYQLASPPLMEVVSVEIAALQKRVTVVPPAVDYATFSVQPPEATSTVISGQQRPGLNLPAGFSIPGNAEFTQQGLPSKLLCEGDGAEMVLIEGGVFTRGSNLGPKNAGPEHLAFVSSFYMDSTEVTLGQYQRFLDRATGSPAPSPAQNVKSATNFPALGIMYRDAEKYAETFGKTLPTEAEWECAARGLQGNLYPWGNGRPAPLSLPLETILPVASRPTDLTKTGLFDMAGNAREWTSDWYSATAYASDFKEDGSPVRNPQGPRRGDKLGERVTRGSNGTWKLWLRTPANLRETGPDVGFRTILRITSEILPATP